MHTIHIDHETEVHQGWCYQVRVISAGEEHRFQVTMSWAEHDWWSHGRVPPEKVVRAAMLFLLEREPVEAIFKKFDCAVIRRYFPEVDQELPKLIGRT